MDYMELIRGDVKVELLNLGEGISGDFDPNNPDDVELLRFEVSRKANPADDYYIDWESVEDASYCTHIASSTPIGELREFLNIIMDEVYEYVTLGQSIKRVCESLSWLGQ